jgi:hypothetical protein
MQKPKKINYYSAGLISILLLPLLSILYLKNNDAFTEYGAIKLAVWNGENFEPEITHFLNSKKFTVVNLTGSLYSDKAKLKIAQKKIKELILSKDSINGIKYHFEKKSEYWAFIKVLDILESEKATFYLPYKNDIWFANTRESKKKIKSFICGTIYHTIYIDQRESIKGFEKIIEFAQKFYLSIIAYCLMLFFTCRRIICENKCIR